MRNSKANVILSGSFHGDIMVKTFWRKIGIPLTGALGVFLAMLSCVLLILTGLVAALGFSFFVPNYVLFAFVIPGIIIALGIWRKRHSGKSVSN